jgi:hypothetical protein
MRVLRGTPAALVTLVTLLAACGDDGASTSTETTSSTSSTTSSTGGAGGSGGAGGEGGAACVSGLEQATTACTACQDANCCLSATAAAEDPGTWTSSGAKICREANCWQECGVEEPECGGIVPSPASCADELYAMCCAEVSACAKNDACTALIYICIDDQGCSPGSDCFDECALGFPGGEEIFDALDECFAGVTCT